MDDEAVAQVRRFNRTVTQRIGALQDAFLARGRPLGHSRVLWEVGADGTDVRTLRSRLDLDSGYLSRVLRALEAEGLVAVQASPADGRVRVARLTPSGVRERAELDARSDEAAAAVLAGLGGARQTRLVAAALGLLIGGALGNVLDRLRHGAVTDFLDFHLGAYHWPAFNLADVAIVSGVALLLLDGFRAPQEQRQGEPEEG